MRPCEVLAPDRVAANHAARPCWRPWRLTRAWRRDLGAVDEQPQRRAVVSASPDGSRYSERSAAVPSALESLAADVDVGWRDAARCRAHRARTTRPVGASLRIAVRQPLSVVGLTQADSVMPVVRSSAFASATVTRSLVPSKLRAPPNRPPAFQVAPLTVPLRPLPVASLATVPDVSLKP